MYTKAYNSEREVKYLNIFKRSILYLKRKKGKAAGIFFLFVFISLLLLCSEFILIKSDQSMKQLRESIGGEFSIKKTQNMEVADKGITETAEQSSGISHEFIDKVLENPQTKYWNAYNYGYAKGKNLQFVPGIGHTDSNNMGKVTTLNYSILDTDFQFDTNKLVKGRHLKEEDMKKVLISQELAELNELDIGDKIQLESADLGQDGDNYVDLIPESEKESIEVEIVGIYTTDKIDAAGVPTAGLKVNMIYGSNDILQKLSEVPENTYFGELTFYVRDPAKIDEIVQEVRKIDEVDWNQYFIRENDFKYEKLSQDLLSLNQLIRILLVGSFLVGMILLLLILMLTIRNRICEAGVYLSIGIEKKKIVYQFILEIIVLAVIGFAVSFLVYLCMQGILEERLFSSVSEIITDVEILQKKAEIEGNSVLLSLEVGLIIFAAELLGAVVAVMIASFPILKLQPKELLSHME